MIPPKEILSVENKYGGLRYNAHIRKYLHIEEWSRPDINYMKNCLYSYIVGTNVPETVVINSEDQYLNSNLNCPIMYHHHDDPIVTNILWCTYVKVQFDKQIISNGLELFVGANHNRAVETHNSISCIRFTLSVMVVHCKFRR